MFIKEIILTENKEQSPAREYGRLILPLRTSFKFTAGGKTYELTDGMAAILSPGELCSVKPAEARYLQIAFTAQGELPAGAYLLNEQEQLILDTLLSVDAADPRLQPLAEYLLLCCSTKAAVEPVAIDRDASIFADATALLQKRVDQSVPVDQLAEELGISLSHLKRIFARYAGKGAHDYFNDLKIEYAKELLSAGHSVTQTAALAGFANQAYFSAAFKRITGQNPKEFSGKKRAYVPTTTASKRSVPKPRKKPLSKPEAQPISQRPRDLPSYLL